LENSNKSQIKKKNWNRNEILKTLSSVARIDLSKITDEVLIRDELGIDSLMGIEIIAKIEKEFDIEIEESLLVNLDTVGDFIKMIEQKIADMGGMAKCQ
jgi:acyl carrier protein